MGKNIRTQVKQPNNTPFKNWDIGIEIQKQGMCYLHMMEHQGTIADNSGELNVQFGGDDTM